MIRASKIVRTFEGADFNNSPQNEMKEAFKHDIIVQITEAMGGNPSCMCKAEQVFESVRYDIAKYIIMHEYLETSKTKKIDNNFMTWIEEKTSPEGARLLSDFIEKYFK